MQPIAAPFTWGSGGMRLSPEQLARRREVEDALLARGVDTSPVGHWTAGLARVAEAMAGAYRRKKLDHAEQAGRESGDAAFMNVIKDGIFPPAPPPHASGGASVASPQSGQSATGSSVLPASFLASVDASEGAGDYDTLFGHAQRSGPFAGVRVSQMPISEVLAFADPSGAYGQSVKSKIGRVATPMGRHQIVGTTLRNAVAEMGLDPSTPFNQQTQDAVAAHLARKRIASADTMGGKISALRSEWEGFKHVPDAQLAQIVTDLESGGGMAIAPGSAGDPNYDGLRPGSPELSAPPDYASQRVAQAHDPALGYAAGDPATQTPEGAAFLGRMMNPDSMTGGAPATMQPVQAVANALVAQQQPQRLEMSGNAGGRPSGPSLQQLMQAAANPWLTPEQKAQVNMLLEQQIQAQDPVRQLQLQKLQREMAQGDKPEFKVVGDQLLKIGPDGSVADATPASQNGGFRYSGNSVEAQSLNGLMDSGALTAAQAQQLGAGKTITGPNGEVIFMTPQGVFGQPAGGGAPQPLGGNIAVTDAKTTIDERKAMGFADRMLESGALIDQFEKAGLDTWGQAVTGNSLIPDVAENWMVDEDFQQFDQARRNFINAQLRRESGAVINTEEFDNANRQYLPRPGDGPHVLEQKRKNRQTVIEAMSRDGGPTYQPPAAKSGGAEGTTGSGLKWKVE